MSNLNQNLLSGILGPGMTDLQEHHLEGPQEDLLLHVLTLALLVKDPPEGGLVHHLVVGEAHRILPIQDLGLFIMLIADVYVFWLYHIIFSCIRMSFVKGYKDILLTVFKNLL